MKASLIFKKDRAVFLIEKFYMILHQCHPGCTQCLPSRDGNHSHHQLWPFFFSQFLVLEPSILFVQHWLASQKLLLSDCQSKAYPTKFNFRHKVKKPTEQEMTPAPSRTEGTRAHHIRLPFCREGGLEPADPGKLAWSGSRRVLSTIPYARPTSNPCLALTSQAVPRRRLL